MVRSSMRQKKDAEQDLMIGNAIEMIVKNSCPREVVQPTHRDRKRFWLTIICCENLK
jgi:hypothetical protein